MGSGLLVAAAAAASSGAGDGGEAGWLAMPSCLPPAVAAEPRLDILGLVRGGRATPRHEGAGRGAWQGHSVASAGPAS
jgi:hypothetical protein